MRFARFSYFAAGLAGVVLGSVACGAKAPESEGTSSAALTDGWTQVTTSPEITSIGAGGSGNVWGIGTGVAKSYGSDGNDYDIYQLINGSWVQQSGGAVQIAVDPAGTPWAVNHAGAVYNGNGGGGWTSVTTSPAMSQVGAGGNSSVWGIGTQVAASYGSAGNDYDIYQLVNGAWVQQSGGAIQVAVDGASGTPWVVNHAGTVYEGNGSGGWTVVTTTPAMSNIGVGAGGIVWGIGTQVAQSYGSAGTDYDIYKLVNGSWVQQSGGAVKIAVSAGSSTPWVANHAGTVYEGACDPVGCPAAGGTCVAMAGTTVCDATQENSPARCTANVADPINPQTGQHDPVAGFGWIDVSCVNPGNGYYTVSMTGASTPGSWFGYSPFSAGTYEYEFLGRPIAFTVDEADGYLPGPACQFYNQCTIHATYVQVCATPGLNELTEQVGVVNNNACVVAPVTYQ